MESWVKQIPWNNKDNYVKRSLNKSVTTVYKRLYFSLYDKCINYLGFDRNVLILLAEPQL